MSEGYRAAVRVDVRRIVGQTQIARDRQRLSGKGLIQFNDVHLPKR